VRLRVSTEVEPAVFAEASLRALGARVVRHVHKGWFTAEVDSDRLEELRRLPGVLETHVVPSCDDRLDQLPPDLTWRVLAEHDCHGLVGFRLEAGEAGGRVLALRLVASVHQTCFLRAHRTAAMDIAVCRPDPAVPGGLRVLQRHSDGLRDQSVAGMHDWKAGETRQITMWVGHLPPGEAVVEAGLLDGWIRVRGRPVPCTFRAAVRLG
jgi:hypothetical protein